LSKRYTIDNKYLEIIYDVVEDYKKTDEYINAKNKPTYNNIDRIASASWLSKRMEKFVPFESNLVDSIVITENERYGLIKIIEYLDRDDISELLKYLKEIKSNEE
jgi:hypothetical protein